jgi:hypothetical protein
MLSPEEFIAGKFESALFGSLILPFDDSEFAALIGVLKDEPTAIFLNTQFKFYFDAIVDLTNRVGLIIPNVRIEVDETSCFNTAYSRPLGTAVRTSDQLGIFCKRERNIGRHEIVTVVTGLQPMGEVSVGFAKWQIVLGLGLEKRTILKFDLQSDKVTA